MSNKYKWPESVIDHEFKRWGETPNYRKVNRFQRFTDTAEACVRMCVFSMRNDREEMERRRSHETGAY